MNEVINNSGLRPVGRAVLVQPYKVEEYTAGGLILPDEVRKKDQLAEQRAVIIEIAPGAWAGESTPRAQVGDRILFSKWAGYQTIGPKDAGQYRIVNDSDIFTVITEGE
jgi:chaperonin GroES